MENLPGNTPQAGSTQVWAITTQLKENQSFCKRCCTEDGSISRC